MTQYLKSFGLCAAVISLDGICFLQLFNHLVRMSAQYIHIFLSHALNFVEFLQDEDSNKYISKLQNIYNRKTVNETKELRVLQITLLN